MTGWLVRRLSTLLWRRTRWVVLAAVGRTAVRVLTDREVDRAADDLDARLPPRVRSALDRLPGDPVRVGGGAVVAGRNARRAGGAVRRLSRGRPTDEAAPSRFSIGGFRERVRDELAGARHDLTREQELARREIRADLALAEGRGRTAADDELLDRYHRNRAPGEVWDRPDDELVDPDPLDQVPPPVRQGRLRYRRPARREVARAQRSYRRPKRPWDR